MSIEILVLHEKRPGDYGCLRLKLADDDGLSVATEDGFGEVVAVNMERGQMATLRDAITKYLEGG